MVQIFALLSFSFGLSSLAFSATKIPDRCSQLIDSCEYYSCIEEERLSCGEGGYPLDYGVKYCQKLSALDFSPAQGFIKPQVFPGDGNIWRDNVRECLQVEMDNYFQSTPDEELSCQSLRDFAFASHPRCYTQTSVSFCELPPESVIKVGTTIGLQDLFTQESLKQVRDTAEICEEQLAERLAHERNWLVGLELQKYRLIWQQVYQNPLLLGSLPK